MHRNKIGDVILSFATFLQIAVLMLQELLVAARIIEHESFRMIGIMFAAVPMLLAMYYIIVRKLVLIIGTYLLALLIILSTLIFFTENEQYIISEVFSESGLFYLLAINIPSFLCLASIRDFDILRRSMLLISYLVFAFGITYCIFLWIGRISYLRYSMTFSYYLLLPALVFVSQKKLIFMFLFIVVCSMMLLLGSRGALITGFFYAFLLLFVDTKSRRLIISSVITMVILFGSFFTMLLTFSSKTGISSRTVEMFLQGNLTDLTGRSWIYETAWQSIQDSPIWGHGIFGDRVVLDGFYAHNLILEIFHNFGLLFGTAIILLISIASVRIFLKSNIENRKLLLLFFCYGILPLMGSSSYLQDPRFGIFIGSLVGLSKIRSKYSELT